MRVKLTKSRLFEQISSDLINLVEVLIENEDFESYNFIVYKRPYPKNDIIRRKHLR